MFTSPKGLTIHGALGRWRDLTASVGLVLLAATFAGSRFTWARHGQSALDLFDYYDSGRHGAVVAAFSGSKNPTALLNDVERLGPSWIAAATADASRRRLIVAAVSLEAAQVPAVDWPRRRQLLEWACGLLRTTDTPTPVERWWHLAAVSLIQQANDAVFLRGSRETDPLGRDRIVATYGPALNHLAHARARFPDEPRLKLAEAVYEYRGRLYYPISAAPPAYRARIIEQAGSVPRVEVDRSDPIFTAQVRRIVAILTPLLSDAAVGAEAHLRIGTLELYSGQAIEALQHFEAAERLPTDAFIEYLAKFFRAASLAHLSRVDEAEAAYRSALAVAPDASSATTGLAMLLFLQHRHAEATDLVNARLVRPPSADPYLAYEFGDARLLQTHLTRLREALR